MLQPTTVQPTTIQSPTVHHPWRLSSIPFAPWLTGLVLAAGLGGTAPQLWAQEGAAPAVRPAVASPASAQPPSSAPGAIPSAAGVSGANLPDSAVAPSAQPAPTGSPAQPSATAPRVGLLPRPFTAALSRAGIPTTAVSVWVQPLDDRAPPRVVHRADVPVNPASVMKLITTYAALDLLGPDYTWKTLVHLGGPVVDGVLQGNLTIKGTGDPKLVIEHITRLLQSVQAQAVRRIAGDVVLDRSAFHVAATDPGAFDGEPLRPYNASPDALLLNFHSLIFTFTPDPANGVAQVRFEPPLAGLEVPSTVPLSRGGCEGYRVALGGDFSNPYRVAFRGAYPTACGEQVWPVLLSDDQYAPRVIAQAWAQVGGQLSGKVRYGDWPRGQRPTFEQASPPLSQVVRDINKFSNNVMAQQVFLSLPTAAARQRAHAALPVATFADARAAVRRWWARRLPGVAQPVMDNGSGLSRTERSTAAALAALLHHAAQSPVAGVLADSLPVAGVDGTLRNARLGAANGQAQLKTGSLRDSTAVAGYVTGRSGQRYVMVAIVNHPNRARDALNALTDWVAQD